MDPIGKQVLIWVCTGASMLGGAWALARSRHQFRDGSPWARKQGFYLLAVVAASLLVPAEVILPRLGLATAAPPLQVLAVVAVFVLFAIGDRQARGP